MKPPIKMMLAGAAIAAYAAGAAQAATLYEFPNFQGRSITINGADSNLDNDGFNDLAQSGRFDGEWTICSDQDYQGRCRTVSGDVRDLNAIGGGGLSSLRRGAFDQYGDNRYGDDRYNDNDRYPGSGGGYGGGGGGYGGGGGGWGFPGNYTGGTSGRSAVFFPRPQNQGGDIAAYNRGAADWFCRRQGLGAAIYYDTVQRGRGWQYQGGGFAPNAPVLRDVLCRR
jgi:hypothetical protein